MARAISRPVIPVPVEQEILLVLSETEAQKLHAVLFSGCQSGEQDLGKIQKALEEAIGPWAIDNLRSHCMWGTDGRSQIDVVERKY